MDLVVEGWSSDSAEHTEWGHNVVMSVEDDRLTVVFDHVGCKTLALAPVHKQDLLTLG